MPRLRGIVDRFCLMTPERMAALHAASFVRGWSAASFAEMLSDDATCAVTRTDGFALARCVLDEAELLTIVVDPDARRRGVGATLLAELFAALQARGVTRLFLEVAADNPGARALYEALGFVTDGIRKGYYPRPEGASDALMMHRVLSDG